ncbi:T9SS type A sorting domain-containing protein [Candidatus Chrysopegis kryptomonas]|uniref:Por secretion system C-terminal sorting domain-containing protein n=1 Tax=Candidatus Chryseopegocella kryptomonas TaxID=1633643 RepID=A0A0P1MU18_9BACT|nr:T9SS type A sorting domain-containing protein [Candidatus Chrysopegis kryptomonas]CUS99439.1 Por secretion system C-terminal sorting domain-containing protein [Candidatus Chrysopegis kryptomonas]
MINRHNQNSMLLNRLLVFFLLAFAFISSAFAQPPSNVVILQGRITRDSTLTSDKQYLLRGFVTVERGATLTIEPGTIIYGEKETKGSLIIKRGAKIYANGTKERPIVFTSARPVGQRAAGDWGGVIILGEAPINVPGGTAVIEGGLGDDGIYGGNNPDDSSGVFRYVRIEFPGVAYQPDNEINGLTLSGVGRKTLIEYVQVSYSGDDSFEWFGGNVNAKYLVAYKGLDDDFDTDFGWSGKVQFALAVRDPNIADISGSNGFESDNDGTGTTNVPRTSGIFSNVTFIGPMPDTNFTGYNPNFRRGAHLRRSTRLSFYNSIIAGWPTGILLDGSNVANDAQNDTLQVRNVFIAGIKSANQVTTNVSGFDAKSWFLRSQYNNRIFGSVVDLKLQDPFNLSFPKPIPLSDSPVIGAADFTNPRLRDPFFTPVNWVGAFGPDSTQRWDLGWTNYDPQNTDYSRFVKVYEKTSDVPSNFELKQNYPNPFNPETVIEFNLAKSSNVKLIVYNMLGQEVAKLVDEYLTPGSYKVKFYGGNLPSGVYIYKLIADGYVSAKKMVLMK